MVEMMLAERQVKVEITWKEFERDIKVLAKLIPKNKYDKLLIITKGGLIPGYYLAKELGIDLIDTVCISSYEDEMQTKLKIKTHKASEDTGWLIVDDLVDSGVTMKEVMTNFPKADAAVLYIKENKNRTLKTEKIISLKNVPESWIVFPWE